MTPTEVVAPNQMDAPVVDVDEHDALFGPLRERGKQLESVVPLVVEKHLLLRRLACLHAVENAPESHVGCLLVFELPQLRSSNLLEHDLHATHRMLESVVSGGNGD